MATREIIALNTVTPQLLAPQTGDTYIANRTIAIVPEAGNALTVTAPIVSTLATGTAPLVVASTTQVSNLNASLLGGASFAAPGAIGGTTAAAITGTTVTATASFSGPATNLTGLPISTGVSGLAAGVATFLATPSSTNFAAVMTDETGSGAVVFATSPTLITPVLGTPASGVATNLTGLPLTTGVTGLLPVANGGTATATPGIVAGTNVTVTGTWPNQTVNSTGGGAPGGSNTQLQYNNAGAFAGAAGITTDGTDLTIASASRLLWATDLILGRKAAANLRFGAVDAAAPAAQTLSVQNVATGTSNTAGATFTISGSQGTGTGLGGSLVFQTAPAGGSGTAQNALAAAMTIDSARLATFAGGITAGNFIVAATGNTVTVAGAWAVSSAAAYPLVGLASGQFGWASSGSITSASAPDTILTRRAAANLQFGAADAAAAVAQTLSAQSVVAGTSNTAGANLTVAGSQGTGTGIGGSLIWQVAPAGSTGTAQNALATALTIDSTKLATFTGAVKTLSTTVAALPSASTSGAGARAFVTDANATTFLSTVAAGGANKVPVVSDGTNWLIG